MTVRYLGVRLMPPLLPNRRSRPRITSPATTYLSGTRTSGGSPFQGVLDRDEVRADEEGGQEQVDFAGRRFPFRDVVRST